jgi:acetyltransferase-like isoleucine patch superfamily enzyme
MRPAWETPWKAWNAAERWLLYPLARLHFALCGAPWGEGWQIFGLPVIQKHRRGVLRIGKRLALRSTPRSNPLGVHHPVILAVWQAGAELLIGDDFGMTGGAVCAARSVRIGDRVILGANSVVTDTDFHPLEAERRRHFPADGRVAPVMIEDDVFIGMSCIVLKGVTIGRGSVIGAGSVVTRDVPPGSIAAGNPARVIGSGVRAR